MIIAALFIIAKKQRQPKYPPTNEWIKMMWYIYTNIIRKKIMAFAATWMNLKIIILSKVS